MLKMLTCYICIKLSNYKISYFSLVLSYFSPFYYLSQKIMILRITRRYMFGQRLQKMFVERKEAKLMRVQNVRAQREATCSSVSF